MTDPFLDAHEVADWLGVPVSWVRGRRDRVQCRASSSVVIGGTTGPTCRRGWRTASSLGARSRRGERDLQQIVAGARNGGRRATSAPGDELGSVLTLLRTGAPRGALVSSVETLDRISGFGVVRDQSHTPVRHRACVPDDLDYGWLGWLIAHPDEWTAGWRFEVGRLRRLPVEDGGIDLHSPTKGRRRYAAGITVIALVAMLCLAVAQSASADPVNAKNAGFFTAVCGTNELDVVVNGNGVLRPRTSSEARPFSSRPRWISRSRSHRAGAACPR